MDVDVDLTYYCDHRRHLVCVPFSVENLHIMAERLKIKPHWFHKCRHPHYDIPKKRIKEITEQCTVVSSETIYNIIHGNPWS